MHINDFYEMEKRTFSLELRSNFKIEELRCDKGEASIYGLLGSVKSIKLLDGVILEIETDYCTLHMDITREDLLRNGFVYLGVNKDHENAENR